MRLSVCHKSMRTKNIFQAISPKKLRSVISCILIVFAGIALAVLAQDNPIAAIQKLYAQTSETIRLALQAEKEGAGAGLYSTEVFVNSHHAPWRAVGNYSKRIIFWYTDQPEFARYENKAEDAVLVKIEVKETAAVRTQYSEFLFDQGQLVFYFTQEKAGDQPAEERRYYFKAGQLRRSMVGSNVVNEKPDTTVIFRQAESYKKLFLSTF